MSQILVTLQIFIVLALVILVFIQKSDDEGVANLTKSSTGMNKGSAMTFINKVTIVVAFAFMINSIAMARLENVILKRDKAILYNIDNAENNVKINLSNDLKIYDINQPNNVVNKGKIVDGNNSKSDTHINESINEKEKKKIITKNQSVNSKSNVGNIPLIGQTQTER